MIARTDNIICGPLNAQQNIYKILFKNIGYSSEVLEDGFISRNVNLYENKNNRSGRMNGSNIYSENENTKGKRIMPELVAEAPCTT